MKYLCFFLFSCFLAQNALCQIDDKPIDVQFVLQSIDSINNTTLSEFDKLTAKDSLFDLLRFHYDYLSYKTKFELAKNTQNKEDRIMHIKRVTRYPYYLISSSFYFYKFYFIY
jgi:UDP-N-acetylglucosamine pyrophosphorylase